MITTLLRFERWSTAAGWSALLVLGGCAVGPDYRPVMPTLDSTVPVSSWRTSLPTAQRVQQLEQWWTGFNDPTLSALIDDAQQDNPTLEQAIARLDQARAGVAQHQAQGLPTLSARENQARSRTISGGWSGLQGVASGELDASWEIDLFGKGRRGVEGAQARLAVRRAEWYDARVTLAAEVADAYVVRRACESTLLLDDEALRSQRATERLTDQKTQAGFTAESDLARAEAGTAQAAATRDQQHGACERDLNRLVLLTGVPPATLEQRLQAHMGQVPRSPVMMVTGIPAQVLAQRPDVAARERSVAAASAAIGVAQADRYPSLSLAGMIGINRSSFGGMASTGPSWSIGPTLDLPLFDAGQRKAAVDQAKGAYAEAVAAYRINVRQAVNEVEDALVRLATVDTQARHAQRAAERYAAAFRLIDQGYAAGFNSLMDLEDSRRTWLSAQTTAIGVEQERAQATIALYKALGGGWAMETGVVEPTV